MQRLRPLTVLTAELGFVGEIEFLARVGSITVSEAAGHYWLDLPAFPPAEMGANEARVRVLLDHPPDEMFRSFENLLAELHDQSAVETYVPDLAAITALHPSGLVVTARAAESRCDFVSRYFAPSCGIPEDPVTGSIHATLFLAGERVFIGGRVVTFMKAQLRLDDRKRYWRCHVPPLYPPPSATAQ